MGVKTEDSSGSNPPSRQNVATGRPKRTESEQRMVSDALLAAADQFITDEKTSNVSVRRIAAKAGVNQAMINYYFNNKNGLIFEIFQRNFFSLVGKLKDFENRCANHDDDDVGMSQLIYLIDEHFAESPSLFVLHKEMLSEESEINDKYSNEIGSRGYETVVRIMRLLIDRGICRNDISPEHAAYLICVLGAVHYIMTPISNTAFHGLMDGERKSELGKLATALLGAGPDCDQEP